MMSPDQVCELFDVSDPVRFDALLGTEGDVFASIPAARPARDA